MALWPFGKKNEQAAANVSLIDGMTRSLVQLHELGSLGYALIGLSVIVVVLTIAVAVTSKALLDAISGILPWLFWLVIVFGAFGVVLLAIERIAVLRLADLRMRLIISLTGEMVRASIPQHGQMDSAHVGRIFSEVLIELERLSSGRRRPQPEKLS